MIFVSQELFWYTYADNERHQYIPQGPDILYEIDTPLQGIFRNLDSAEHQIVNGQTSWVESVIDTRYILRPVLQTHVENALEIRHFSFSLFVPVTYRL